MSKVAIQGNASGTGTFTIAAPNSNTDRTLTLPDEAGTVLTSGGAIDVDASAPADSLAIDASGNVGINTTSPSAFAINVVRGSGMGTEPTWESSARNLALFETDNAEGYVVMGAPASGFSAYAFADAGSKAIAYMGYSHSDDSMRFNANGSEKMRINADGIMTGKTVQSVFNVGCGLAPDGYAQFTRDGGTVLYVNRGSNDGTLVAFYQNNTQEGSISVSGSTVSYNGGHLARWSQLADNTRDDSIVKGTVMSNLDQMAEWTTDGVTESNEQLNCMQASDVEGDVNVAGVFVNWDNDDDIYTNDMNIAMTGDMVIRIAEGVTVERGDLLMSAGDGTAKPQGDDIVRSKTIAKVTSTHVSHTYDDGSYLVPCVLMAC